MSLKSIREASIRVEELRAQYLRAVQVRNVDIRRQRFLHETPRNLVAESAGLSPAMVTRIEEARPEDETYDDGE